MEKMPYRYGCLWFPNPEEPVDGIFSIAGSQPSLFDSVSELPSDVIWWSNLSYAACRNSSVGNMVNVRYNKFLIISPEECLAEWGYPANSLSNEQCVIFSSRVFSRIMSMAYSLIRESNTRRPPHQVFSTHDLRNDFMAIMPRLDFPKGEAASVVKTGYSFVNYTGVAQRMQRGLARIQLKRPRLSHAIDMLTTPVPSGEMTFVSGKKMGSNPLNEVLNEKVPYLSEVTVSNIDPAIAPVFAYGSSMDRNQKIIRAWLPHPEIMSVAAFADVSVKGAWRGEKYSMLYETLPTPIIEFVMSKYAPISWSAGVIAETIWRALCMKSNGHFAPGEERPDTSWPGLWLKSSDKAVTFLSAMDLTTLGWQASSYGYGSIWMSCHASQADSLIQNAFACGLIPRMDGIPKEYDASTFEWGGDQRAASMASLVAQRNVSMLLSMDKIMVAPAEDRDMVMAQILKDLKSKMG